MNVRYNRLQAILMAVLSGINLVLGVWLFLLNRNFNISIFLGVLMLVVTIACWTRPYFQVEAHQVVVLAMIGPLKRTFPYEKLQLQDGRLMVEDGGIAQRIPVYRWLSHTEDWAQLERISLQSP